MAERILTINLRRYLVTQPRNKRARKAVKYIRERVAHYNKLEIDNVRINQELNSLIVKRYAREMSPVKLVVNVVNGIATATDFTIKPKEVPKAASDKKGEKKLQQPKVEKPQTEKPKQAEKPKAEKKTPDATQTPPQAAGPQLVK
jgi:ribosomal protein L31E